MLAGPEILKGAPGTHREAAEKVLRQKGVSVIRNRKVGVDNDESSVRTW